MDNLRFLKAIFHKEKSCWLTWGTVQLVWIDLFILELCVVCTVFFLESVFFLGRSHLGSSDLGPKYMEGISNKHKQRPARLSEQTQRHILSHKTGTMWIMNSFLIAHYLNVIDLFFISNSINVLVSCFLKFVLEAKIFLYEKCIFIWKNFTSIHSQCLTFVL